MKYCDVITYVLATDVVLKYKISHIPFIYLGMPIGRDHRRLSFWQSLIEVFCKNE